MFFTRVIAQVKRTCNVCRWCTLVLLLQSATTPPLDSRFMTSLIPTPVCHVTLLFITSTDEEMFVSRFVGWLVCPLARSPDYHSSDRPFPPTASVPPRIRYVTPPTSVHPLCHCSVSEIHTSAWIASIYCDVQFRSSRKCSVPLNFRSTLCLKKVPTFPTFQKFEFLISQGSVATYLRWGG